MDYYVLINKDDTSAFITDKLDHKIWENEKYKLVGIINGLNNAIRWYLRVYRQYDYVEL